MHHLNHRNSLSTGDGSLLGWKEISTLQDTIHSEQTPLSINRICIRLKTNTKTTHKKRPFDIESEGMKGEVAQPRYNCLNWACPDYIQYPHVLISRLLRYTEQARDHILQYSVTMTYMYKNSTCKSSGLAVYNIYIISS